jgi:hypothetical protein
MASFRRIVFFARCTGASSGCEPRRIAPPSSDRVDQRFPQYFCRDFFRIDRVVSTFDPSLQLLILWYS